MGKRNHKISQILIYGAKMAKNFFSVHKSNILVFLPLVGLILFVLFRTLIEDFREIEGFSYLQALVVFCVSYFGVSYLFPKINTDQSFLVREMGKRDFLALRVFQHFLLSVIALILVGLFPIFMSSLHPNYIFFILPILFIFSMLAGFKLTSKRERKDSSLHKGSFFDLNLPVLDQKTSSMLALNLVYLLRTDRKNLIAQIFLILFLNICVVGVFFQNPNISPVAFAIPFLVTCFFAVDKNVEIYQQLKNYSSPFFWRAFISDYLFWLNVFLVQWVLSVFTYWSFGVNVLSNLFVILCLIPILVATVLIVKFKYLQSRLLRSLSFASAIALPFTIPIFAWLFYWEIKND